MHWTPRAKSLGVRRRTGPGGLPAGPPHRLRQGRQPGRRSTAGGFVYSTLTITLTTDGTVDLTSASSIATIRATIVSVLDMDDTDISSIDVVMYDPNSVAINSRSGSRRLDDTVYYRVTVVFYTTNHSPYGVGYTILDSLEEELQSSLSTSAVSVSAATVADSTGATIPNDPPVNVAAIVGGIIAAVVVIVIIVVVAVVVGKKQTVVLGGKNGQDDVHRSAAYKTETQ